VPQQSVQGVPIVFVGFKPIRIERVVEERILDAVQLVPQAIRDATEPRRIGMDDADAITGILDKFDPVGGSGDVRLIIPPIALEALARRNAHIDQRTVCH
jgi:hypothetical protein